MKKFFALFAALLMAATALSARDKVYRNTSVLPQAARQVIAAAFPKTGVSHVKVDERTFGGNEYEVIFTDGSEIEFNSKGEWTDVDGGVREVPSYFVLKPIAKYIKTNFKGAKIFKIEKDRNEYDVELSNGKELKFDRAGNFLRLDD